MVTVEDTSMGNRALLIENGTSTIENRALLILIELLLKIWLF